MNRILAAAEDDDTPPACAPTVARVLAVLDGEVTPAGLADDAHTTACAGCRGRVRAARALLSVLGQHRPPVAVPAGLTTAILTGLRADRRARARRRVLTFGGALATAAAVVVAVWVLARPGAGRDVVRKIPAPTPTPQPPAPVPPPLRVDAELARAGDAIRVSSRAVTDPLAAAPKLFASLPEWVLPGPAPQPIPAGTPGRDSLAEISGAARAGLEPVTGSARKAYARFVRDVGAMSLAKSKS